MTSGEPPRSTGDLDESIRAHCALFNACVATGDWTPFVATFAEDVRMVTTVAPDRPIVGRELLARMYAKHPPTQAMTMTAIEVLDDDTALARFRWERGGAGEMTVRWRDGLVADVSLRDT
ncbi:MAG TPA: nuclear transport factor 2 family protein [Jatrophihabitans sp.]|jgi:hypothetical protein|uniref:nuclear transport factor 2 family protein n=1 Tax=Jatrophihabitans sp. TaxID=1932789 RepID=UPI002EF8507F